MDVLAIMLSVITLLFIAVGAYMLSRKISVPYTILLVLVGLVLIPISETPLFHFLQSFTLTPGLLFFVFLPTLIFESAYNMNIRSVLASFRSISILSIGSLLVSAFFIAFALKYLSALIGFPLPFEVTLLFGALISATDPVAVLSLFKEYGAPKRLSLIFEGESLFNDGTSLAFFLVILEMYLKFSGDVLAAPGVHLADILHGIFMFTTMVLGGIAFGALMGGLFSKLIQFVHNSESVEITLTMIVAHMTFMFSEVISQSLVLGGQPIHFSSIIATVVAAMVVGNYGRYKISPSVFEYMEHFWGYFAFVANSIIFILIGLLFASLPIGLMEILPITLLAIGVVMVGRALSVYPIIAALNFTKKEEYIPLSWQHLLAWGSLRGALAITMVLLIPDSFTVSGWNFDFSVKDFITALTIVSIYFTLFVKGLTIGPMLRYFKLDALSEVETGEYHEARALLFAKLLLEVERFGRKGYIGKEVEATLWIKYRSMYEKSCEEGKNSFGDSTLMLERVLAIYALAMAKHSLKVLFISNEVSESVFKKILTDLEIQMEKIENSRDIPEITLSSFERDWLDRVHDLWEEVFQKDPERDIKTQYMFNRAHAIIMHKALEEVTLLSGSELALFEDKTIFSRFTVMLNKIEEDAKHKAEDIRLAHDGDIAALSLAFAEAGLLKARKQIIETFGEREVVSQKVRMILEEDLALIK